MEMGDEHLQHQNLGLAGLMGTPWMTQRREHDQKLLMPKILQRWKELERESINDIEKQKQEGLVLEPDGRSRIQTEKQTGARSKLSVP